MEMHAGLELLPPVQLLSDTQGFSEMLMQDPDGYWIEIFNAKASRAFG